MYDSDSEHMASNALNSSDPVSNVSSSVLEDEVPSLGWPPRPLGTSQVERDDSNQSAAYSYTSEWSSNYTMSNLPGPGRILGNLLSLAGSSLERNLGRIVYRSHARRVAKAKKTLLTLFVYSNDEVNEQRKEAICRILLAYARSDVINLQILAFRTIIRQVVHFPSLRFALQAYCRAKGEPIEVTIFAWKRPNVNYGPNWLFHYRVASLCLTSNPIMNYVPSVDFKIVKKHLERPLFEGLLMRCSDVHETCLAIEVIGRAWVPFDLRSYLGEKSFNGGVHGKLAAAILSHFEICNSYQFRFKGSFFDGLVSNFLLATWSTIDSMEPEETDLLSEDGTQLEAWSNIYAICCVLRSDMGKEMTRSSHDLFALDWATQCQTHLGHPKHWHIKLYRKLMEFEVLRGPSIRARFPPTSQS